MGVLFLSMAHWKKRETIFREYGFTVTMPGNWQQRDTGDLNRWFYRSPDRREQLTLTRLEEVVIDHGEAETAIRKAALRTRRAVELAFGRVPDVSYTPMATGEHDGNPLIRFEGEVPSARLWFASMLLFDTRMAWALFYESHKLGEEEARERAQALLATAHIG